MNVRDGVQYELFEKSTGKTFYVGISDSQDDGTGRSQELIRFDGHIGQCLALMKTKGADFTHLYMLGKVVEQAQAKGIAKDSISPALFEEVVGCRAVKKVRGTRH